jgi:hypothetical protein
MKLKIITGFRDDQFMIISGEEAHKAYYLFLHPDERAVFANGVALIGKNIQEIVPAYNEIMGWNPTHKLDGDDWNDIRSKGIDKAANLVLSEAKEVAYLMEKNPSLGMKKLSEAKLILGSNNSDMIKQLAEKLSA